jgi:hypothetical protein
MLSPMVALIPDIDSISIITPDYLGFSTSQKIRKEDVRLK